VNLQKWHGLGNDYLFLDARSGVPARPAALARVLADRRRGPGGDGLILLEPSTRPDADCRLSIRNADGSDGGVCGNGLRCLAAWVIADDLVPIADRIDRAADRLRIEIASGPSIATVDDRDAAAGRWSVTVDLPGPDFDPAAVPATPFVDPPAGPVLDALVPELVAAANAALAADRAAVPDDVRWSIVSTGNPHLVARFASSPDLDAVDLAVVGAALERDPHFPDRINVHVVVDGRTGPIPMRTWERGSGLTQACGTGACAAVTAMVAAGRRPGGEPVTVRLPGGELSIAWSGDPADAIRMTGEAERVARIEIDDRWIDRMVAADRDD